MTTSGNDIFVISQESTLWVGTTFLPNIGISVSGYNASVVVSDGGRKMRVKVPPYNLVCATKDCDGKAGYQTLELRNPTPTQTNRSAGGVVTTDFLYYYEECVDKSFETDPSICYEIAGVNSPCAWAGKSCKKCLANSLCPGGPRAWPVEGFWSAGESKTDVYRCRTPSNERCNGYNISSHSSTCKEGYKSGTPFCDICDKGYYESIDGRCNLCGVRQNWTMAIFLPLA